MQGWYSRMVAIGLGLAAFAIRVPVMAQSETIPTARVANIDWPEVARGALAIAPELGAPPNSLAAKRLRDIDRQLDRFVFAEKEALRPLVLLNAMTAGVNSHLAKVPIPVLAPIDSSRYVSAFASSRGLGLKATSDFLSPTISRMQFLAKTTGYDAILTVKPSLLPRGYKVNANLVQIHLGGTGLLYDVNNENKSGGDALRGDVVEDQALQDMYPRLRRNVSDDGLTYTFFKYGVFYFANISCAKDPPFVTDFPCKEVEGLLRTVLRDLRLVGGLPGPVPHATGSLSPRPAKKSPSFTYYAPGNLLPGTSQGDLGGVTQKILWGASDLRFPIELNPAYANSQTFMHGGDCLGHKIPLDHGRYKCQENPGKILEPREDNMENYAYPWRDNYCEERNDTTREPRDCPAGKLAHEGQDIRPPACQYDGTRCKINLYNVVAVTNGSALWKANNNVKFIADDDTGVYFVYLHMSPDALAGAGLKQGQLVHRNRGQKIGEVGNWMQTQPNGTTAHLHFEIRSQSETCGGFGCTSSPYWTLIRAYEGLIGMQGTEIP
ncbi:M23 family metallopeptidase [Bradyrhizobium diazoefficiens]|uniref:M23 family metallopeptidase n=1 Tax=Bradyrhizobium diazoefficiens TaxID=1355477 RepID=UPI00190E2C77|nr:M23 family metallopeptidase [Bradyrhizobium diazoefficiens]MBK3660190.1 M23 family metallopeptidase [Bradyrhizobium diazoefficiens]